ncbi:hypothetical protein [Bradyrhizobium sp. SZCCHNRI1001]|uniref:hypothetical protein n=1 Tax=Bradyrhizobium sp. SZCCHNRI1001 TaxID=3057273 RepID=UPI0028E1C196|nr:hypothetical protein [Bradyrhizobium sp. SZCCHNRI1001]
MPDHSKMLALIAASEDEVKLRTWIANAQKRKAKGYRGGRPALDPLFAEGGPRYGGA